MDPENNVVENEEPSLRDTLEGAFEEHEGAETEQPSQPQPSAEPKPATAPSVAAPVAPEGKAPAPVPTEGKPAKQGEPAKQGAPATESLKAPSQWKPHVREQWNKLPREVQEEVLRREADSMRLIGSVGPKIRMADEVAQQLSPFVQNLQARGVHPSQFVGDIFETVKHLSFGDPQGKAEVIANIVQAYNVDLRLLDNVLSGRIRTPPEVHQARLTTAQAQAVIQQQQASAQQQQTHQADLEAEKHLAAFGADPKHEFFDDVRDLMADLLEAGKVKDLEDAYASAVWANPDTRKILLQREAQQRVSSKTQRAQAARRASSSISGSPNTPGAALGGGDRSLRETIEAAFDEHSSL
jgi:hypothetical protein